MRHIVKAIAFVASILIFSTCEKFELKTITKVETGTATPLAKSISVNGKIIDLSGDSDDDHGFCYASHSNPTVNDSKISAGKPQMGGYSCTINGLNQNSQYYIRAYCKSSGEIVYGNSVSISTKDGIPKLSTTAVKDITGAFATSGGSITSDGGDPIKARGVVWGTSQNPTVGNNAGIINNGTGLGNFESNMLNLKPNTTYYVRSYASNSIGTTYGEQLQFTTTNGLPVIATKTPKGVSSTAAVSGGIIRSDGGYSITSKGLIWSTTPNPTVSSCNGKIMNESGVLTFISTLSGLNLNTTYYVRSYATNSIGTSYGEEYSFTTLSDGSDMLEIWEYNPVDDNWTSKGSLTFAYRNGVLGFAINQKVYFGLGDNDDENNGLIYYNDFYEFNPTTNTITRKADYVAKDNIQQTSFSIGSLGFIGAGYSASEFWCFDPAQNRWSRKADLGGSSRSVAVSFSIEGKGYITTGGILSGLNDIWEYSPTTNSWSRKADFPGIGRKAAVGFAIGGKGYVGGGSGDGVSNWPKDFYEFDPSLNRWTRKADITFDNFNRPSFVIGSKAYVVGYSTLYEYNPATNIWSTKNNLPFTAISELFCFTAYGKGYALVFPPNSQKSQAVREEKQLMIQREKMNRLKIGRAF